LIYKPADIEKAVAYVTKCLNNGHNIEVKRKTSRSLSQNKYLHVILGGFAMEYGETIEYTKQIIFKRLVNPQIFQTKHINKKREETRIEWRSTADLTTEETTQSIERFRTYSSKEFGIYLPEPHEKEIIEEIEYQISKQQEYL